MCVWSSVFWIGIYLGQICRTEGRGRLSPLPFFCLPSLDVRPGLNRFGLYGPSKVCSLLDQHPYFISKSVSGYEGECLRDTTYVCLLSSKSH